jgi:hypothetical protein
MNPLPSTAKTQFIKRAQFLAKDSGAAVNWYINVERQTEILRAYKLAMFTLALLLSPQTGQ